MLMKTTPVLPTARKPPSPESAPANAYVASTMAVTLTPERRAVTRLVPMANKFLPKAVRSISSHINPAKKTHMMIAPGIPKISGRAITLVMIGETAPLTLPCWTIRIMPVTTPDMPSVITSGEIFRKEIPVPLTSPIAAPTRIAANNAGSTRPSFPLTNT